MSWTRRAQFDAQRSLAFGSISGTYALIGTIFTEPVRIPFFFNGTDALLQFSTDGVTDHFVLPSQGGWTLDITANNVDDAPFFLPAGRGIWVKEIGNPTSGSVYIMGIIAPE